MSVELGTSKLEIATMLLDSLLVRLETKKGAF